MTLHRDYQPSRLDVRTVQCPECLALPGERCFGRRQTRDGKPYLRDANHRSRVDLFLAVNQEAC